MATTGLAHPRRAGRGDSPIANPSKRGLKMSHRDTSGRSVLGRRSAWPTRTFLAAAARPRLERCLQRYHVSDAAPAHLSGTHVSVGTSQCVTTAFATLIASVESRRASGWWQLSTACSESRGYTATTGSAITPAAPACRYRSHMLTISLCRTRTAVQVSHLCDVVHSLGRLQGVDVD